MNSRTDVLLSVLAAQIERKADLTRRVPMDAETDLRDCLAMLDRIAGTLRGALAVLPDEEAARIRPAAPAAKIAA